MTKKELFEKAMQLPLLPGVYIIRDKDQAVIYVGKAKKLRSRVSQYFREGVPHDQKTNRMIAAACHLDVIVTTSENEALVLECSQIKHHAPKYNILLRDDKGYSYVRVTKEPYPRMSAELQLRPGDTAQYIGPFMGSYAVRQMVENANATFRLPTCQRRFPEDFGKGRPCLNFHIERCMGVCRGNISQDQYNEDFDQAVRLVRYGKGEMVKQLRQRMEQAAEAMAFERAAQLRNQIYAIERVRDGQSVVSKDQRNQDVVAFIGTPRAVCAAVLRFREGMLTDKEEYLFYDEPSVAEVREAFLERYYVGSPEVPPAIAVDEIPQNRELLQQVLSAQKGQKVRIYVPQKGDSAGLLQMAKVNAEQRLAREQGRGYTQNKVLTEVANLLGLSAAPALIEAYDISNLGPASSVAGMVVFENGAPKKSGYRRFRVKTIPGQDDTAAMAEVLLRRVKEYENGGKAQFGQKPDLILLDGGKGQLSAVREVLLGTAFADVPLFGMVKDDRHRTRAIVGVQGEVGLSMHRSAFAFVAQIQNEVHRFALAYQRQSHKKKAFASTLTEIPGVGPGKAKLLLRHFRTIAGVREADMEALLQVKSLGKPAAAAVFRHYHGEQE